MLSPRNHLRAFAAAVQLAGSCTGPTAADPITIGEATTVYSQPLRADGTVDYPAALSDFHRVAPADNAAPVLAQVRP